MQTVANTAFTHFVINSSELLSLFPPQNVTQLVFCVLVTKALYINGMPGVRLPGLGLK